MKRLLTIRKKAMAAAFLLIFVLSFAACQMTTDKVVASLGKYENRQFYTSGGFQDYTDYAKYNYDSAEVAGNQYLKRIRETDLAEIDRHLDDFEGWIEVIGNSEASSEVVVHFDFDREIIDTEDYFYIDSEEHTWRDGTSSLVRYNLYLFDVQTQILYYFHNNI